MPRSDSQATDFVLPPRDAKELIRLSQSLLPGSQAVTDELAGDATGLPRFSLSACNPASISRIQGRRSCAHRSPHGSQAGESPDYVVLLQGELALLCARIFSSASPAFAIRNVRLPANDHLSSLITNGSPALTGCGSPVVRRAKRPIRSYCLIESWGHGEQHAGEDPATDVNEAAEKARTGCYIDNIAVDVSPERLRRFFKTNSNYQISSRFETCAFSRHNVVRYPSGLT
jgi:hypothetical protein